ncbi:MAG: lipoyl(octanoyl) transferase [Candidatus Sulfotelmatobacter sp.]
MISVIQLGTIDYATGLRLQQQLVALRKEEKIGDVLLLLEHKPVITLGRNAKAANVIASPELLTQRGVELFECDRGGDVTFHGPGQLVGYPIFDLRGFAHSSMKFSDWSSRAQENDSENRALESTDRGSPPTPVDEMPSAPSTAPRKHLGAVDFVRRLEEVLIRTCADFAIETKRIPGLTGVWTNPAHGAADALVRPTTTLTDEGVRPSTNITRFEAKLAAIGIHISRSVTSHGFALNVNPDLTYFNLIIPCGITAKPVTSMQRELGKELDMTAVAESISRNFSKVFSTQILWLETIDALPVRTIGVPMKRPDALRALHQEDTFWS